MKFLNTGMINININKSSLGPICPGLVSFTGKDDTEDNNENYYLKNDPLAPKSPDARHFISINRITKALPLIEIKLKDRADVLFVSSATAAKYLSNDKGTTDPSLLEKFTEIYTKNLQERLDAEDEACKVYIETIRENSKSRNKKDADTDKINSSSATAAILLSSSDKRIQIAKKQAYKETELFFEISKTNKGYDFSRGEEKRQIAGLLHTLEQNSYHAKHLPIELRSAAKKSDGSLDVDFAKLICAFLAIQDFITSPLYIADEIKYFTEKDPENKTEIIEDMFRLNKTDYQLDNNDPAFEDLMNACFTKDGNYIKGAMDVILDLARTAGILLDLKIEADIIDESDILYYLDLTKTIILGYLENIIDEDGNINETEIPSEKELQDTIEEMFGQQ